MSKANQIQEIFETMSGLRRLMHGGFEEFSSRYNLTRPQLGLLFLLLHKDGLSVSEIAGQTGVTNGAATQTIDVMVRRGLIERRSDEHDRRVSRLMLTPAGHELAAGIKSDRMKVLTSLFSELDEGELKALSSALSKLTQLMQGDVKGQSQLLK